MQLGRPAAHGCCEHPSHARAGAVQGFTYVWVMAALAIFTVGLAAVGPMWADQTQRDREQDLIRIGRLYAQAIADYHAASPGTVKEYPESLHDLLQDSRHWNTRRYLRKLYPDPVNRGQAWGLVLGPDGRVRGVFSQAAKRPLRREALNLGLVELPAGARSYAEWQFVPAMPARVATVPVPISAKP